MTKFRFDIAKWRAIMSAMRFSYIRVLASFAVGLGVSGAPLAAFSAEPVKSGAEQPYQSPKQRLDALFDSLKKIRDSDQANEIADMIWMEWHDSGSATINLLLQWSSDAAGQNRLPAALEFLDQAIALKPEYAEAWNQRATLHYKLKNYRKAMADITVVLKLEPRHFGALAGMAAILEERGLDEQAMATLERLLAVYPAERQAQTRLNAIADKLAGNRT
jgi:tetratricopeptide (TPR) repeat protein